MIFNCVCILAQSSIVDLKKGTIVKVPYNKSSTKYVEFIVKNITFSDSTSSYCVLHFDLLVKSIGKATILGSYENFFGYDDNMCIIHDNINIAKNDSSMVECTMHLYNERSHILQFKDCKLFKLPIYNAEIYKKKQKLEQERIHAEFQARQDSINEAMYQNPFSNRTTVKISLLPNNMINFLGTVNRNEFEKIVGKPVGNEEDFVIYDVINTYDEIETGIRCYYRESDGKLISVKFGTPHYLGYWIDFTRIKGYPLKEGIAKSNGNFVGKKDRLGRLYQVNLKLGTFGCQIMDIFENHNYSTAIINYHVVK